MIDLIEMVKSSRAHHIIKSTAYLDHWRHWRQQLATDANSGADFAIDEVHCLLDNRRVTLVWGMRRA
jgi:hypothetical protein